ncbi:hypothetical protein FBUS_02272 [Fasciolopsis buskii]|uniref:Uncharacterized protein n=1 Tax=Fasciolopsis buskii TaxID=27845 RepID=A0A8E0VMX0_9TREM|nr:hypothetical protein FBUS_02272 [Fasciolopsis buski]
MVHLISCLVLEGVYLLKQNISPYDNNLVHQLLRKSLLHRFIRCTIYFDYMEHCGTVVFDSLLLWYVGFWICFFCIFNLPEVQLTLFGVEI